ncbi:hypothetical protein Vadar_008693 [Vaccinium darrowii]|uniref:Uncharacterized protein n=1 Tax=Vaccinium darrowii TaxID=229202 RepID=A0ACB7WYY3_9ERIC|nr:hypothetical protein Vadar_008693 [Vaccinium darrowii]
MKHVHQVPPQAMDADGNQLETTALFVADLELNVTDSQLYHEFSRLGQVLSVRLCRDKEGKSLGYGYVNYVNPQDAANALKMLNSTPINEKRIFIMHSNCDPSVPRSGPGNIFIKNLDKAIDHNDLYYTFSSYGKILSCKLVRDPSGQSKGYGFVQYDSDEAAQEAIEKVDGTLLNDKQVFVEPYLTKKEREEAKLTTVFLEIRSESDELKSFGWTKYDSDEAARKVAEKLNGMPLNGEQVLRAFLEKQKFTNVFVKNLSESTTKEHLKDIFGKYGRITSAVVMSNADGTSRCFGFVNFKSADDAAQSVKSLNGRTFDNKEWYVGKAQKKSERERELKVRFEQSGKEAADKSQRLNLYIENLDDSIGDDSLKEMFSPFGTITSYKVMRDPHGISKGSGFVAFSTPEEASKALSEMNG